jgi:hypothetical protein
MRLNSVGKNNDEVNPARSMFVLYSLRLSYQGVLHHTETYLYLSVHTVAMACVVAYLSFPTNGIKHLIANVGVNCNYTNFPLFIFFFFFFFFFFLLLLFFTVLLSAFSRSGLVLLTTDLDRAQYNKGS